MSMNAPGARRGGSVLRRAPCRPAPLGRAGLLVMFVLAAAPFSAAQTPLVDTSGARRVMADVIGGAPRTAPPESRVIRPPGEPAVLVRSEEQRGGRYYLFIPTGAGEPEVVTPGTYVVRERLTDGRVEQIKVFLQNDEGSFLRVRAREGRPTLEMDLFLAGAEFYRGVPVPMTMERALVAPVGELQEVTAGLVDWSLVFPDAVDADYRVVESMVDSIRAALPTLTDAEDGAMNAAGRIVSIASGGELEEPGFNCSGFAKWVVDGLYGPLTGSLLPIHRLTTKHLDHRGTPWSRRLEDTRDPYFGLDWTRNLAREISAAREGTDADRIDPEDRDVRAVPIARYREDVGYPTQRLAPILYWLAVAEPGTIYLGSVNRPFGDERVLRQHTHVVVFMPYFDRTGRFHVVVMERNRETSLEALVQRYRNDFVHVVRVRAAETFELPRMPHTSRW